MARGIITLGEVAGRTDMIEIRCGRCGRRGRLNTVRLLREYGPGAAMGEVMRTQVGDCPHRDEAQLLHASAALRSAGAQPAARAACGNLAVGISLSCVGPTRTIVLASAQ